MFTKIKVLIGLTTDCFPESEITPDMILSVLTEQWSTKATIKQKLLVLYSDELKGDDVDDLTIQYPLTTLMTSGAIYRSTRKVDRQHTNIYSLRTEHPELTFEGLIPV